MAKKNRSRVVDPTKTATLRKRLVSKISGRFNKLKTAIRLFVDKNDSLLLKTNQPVVTPGDTNPEKVVKFRQWLEEQIDDNVLELDQNGDLVAVVNNDLNQAFESGRNLAKPAIRQAAGLIDDVESARLLGVRPISKETLELVFQSASENFIDIGADMAAKVSNALSRGLIAGDSPTVIAREMNRIVDISKNRAIVTARTEIVRAHHAGNVAEMEAAGLEDVTVLAEWSTAKDGRVCARCAALEGRIFTMQEIKGLIPLHPQCRCVAIPIIPGITPTSGRPTKAELEAFTAPAAKTKKGTVKKVDIEEEIGMPAPGFSVEDAEDRNSQQQNILNLNSQDLFGQAITSMTDSIYMKLRPHCRQGKSGKKGKAGKRGLTVKGNKGDPGETGRIPELEFAMLDGQPSIRFEKNNGWGDWINLPAGPKGVPGELGSTPNYKYDTVNHTLQFEKPSGGYGPKINLQGKDGLPGDDGEPGLKGEAPKHEIKDHSIRWQNPDDSWGDWITFPEKVINFNELKGNRLTKRDIEVDGKRVRFRIDGKLTDWFRHGGGGTGGGIEEAPQDGKTYGRKDAGWVEVTGGGDVTAAANIADNALVRGDGGLKGIQKATNILVDDDDNITGVNEITIENGSNDALELYRIFTGGLTTCVITGGALTVNGGDSTLFDISNGHGLVLDQFTDPENPVFKEITWSGQTGLTPTHAATFVSYVGFNSSGTLVQQATEFTETQRKSIIVLGFVVTADGTNVNETGDQSHPVFYGYNSDDLARAIGLLTLEGNIFNPASTDLTLRREAGETFEISINRNNDPKNPNRLTSPVDSSVTFTYIYNNGSGGFTPEILQTDIRPDEIDDGSGTLATVSPNKWTNQVCYWFPNGNTAVVQFGDVEYNSLAEACAAITSMTIVNLFDENQQQAIRTIISVKEGAVNLANDTNVAFNHTGKFGFGAAGGGAGGTFQDMQDTYDNSITPEIVTDSTRGAVTFQVGSGADTDIVFECKNTAGTNIFSIDGEGSIISPALDAKMDALFTPKEITTTTYLLLETDNTKLLYFTNVLGCILEVPPGLSLGHNVQLLQDSVGAVEVIPEAFSVPEPIINNFDGHSFLAGEGAVATLAQYKFTTADVYLFQGATA